ncbi:MAG: alpha/beta hydrolase [Deltaproteobacteria bacterium]|nr:alpha/beta hydrolase [Deltaproteobacteria bacterium]
MQELRLQAHGMSFFALADGPATGPLVLLLHGFPELSRSWRHQLPALASAGYRAVAPDLRGYGESDKRGPFDLRTLARDVSELIGAIGHERAIVVGHDWGGAVAWATASYHPEVVDRLVAMNCPPPGVLASEILGNPRQLLRSWYIFMFQLPLLPEWVLTRQSANAVGQALRGGSHVREVWSRQETAPYQEAMLKPGAARAALGYYRAIFRRPLKTRRDGRAHRISAPVLIVWGARDRFLGRETVALNKLAPYLAEGNRPELVFLEDAGHFVQNEAPSRVNEELLRWVGGRAETA